MSFSVASVCFDENYRPAENTRVTTNFANLARGERRQENLRNTLRMIDGRFNELAYWDNPDGDRWSVEVDIISVRVKVDGERDSDDFPTKFYILGLSPNASRLSIRLWIEAEAPELERLLGQHLRDLELKSNFEQRPLSIRKLSNATGRYEPKSKAKFDTKGLSPQLVGELARSVLTGAAYPQSLLATMVRRIRSDAYVGFERVSAIRACLVRNSRLRGAPLEVPVELDIANDSIAYRCGRLFALLEKAQADSAEGELNSTIKDKYFAAASATPALVFPRLFRLNNHHLAKLETPGKIFYNRMISTAMQEPFAFPKSLDLAGQGQFIVGYFQQNQDLYKKRVKVPEEQPA